MMIDFIKELFCFHKWKIIDDCNVRVEHMFGYYERRHKYIVQCEKCGKINYKIV